MTEETKMTPQEFALRMREIAANDDIEEGHATADALLCRVLRELGFQDGISTYEAMPKWFA